jgi:hypothetical protein
MDYKLLSNLDEPLHLNGKIYQKGQTIIERVVVTESEAQIMNLRQTETLLVPIQDTEKMEKPKKVKAVEE